MHRGKVALTLFAAATLCALLLLHAPYINGPRFWFWPYRDLPVVPMLLAISLGAIPFFLGQWLHLARPRRRWAALLLIMLGCLGMKIGSIIYRPDATADNRPGLKMLCVIVSEPFATSYYTDAAALGHLPVRQWLTLFPDLMPQLHLHAKTKPPGPILYWLMWIRLLGEGCAAMMAGGITLGAIATLAIPATDALLRRLLRDDQAAFAGASLLALMPGFVLFFPMFDPVYVLLSIGLIGCWHAAVRDDRIRASIALGALLALLCWVTFNVAVIGMYCAGLILVIDAPLREKMLRATKHAPIALAVAAAILLIGHLVTGYDPIATFRSAWTNQHILLAAYASTRQYPATIPFDLVDLALGCGWVGAVLAILFFLQRPASPHFWLAALGVAQLAIVAALGLLQLETARVWNFMLPLVMLPAGLELGRWNARSQIAVFVVLVIVTAIISARLILVC